MAVRTLTTKVSGVTLIMLHLAVSVIGQPVAKNFRTETKRLFMPAQENVRVRAPEITGGRGWLNTDKPLSLAALKGKVVLLDFWTYGCINCIHIIPDLKKLEAKYPNELVVIGVHSAKFDNEKETENIRRIIMRYEIEHPVYNDADFTVWKSYSVRAWPTQVLIDPAGYVIGGVSGEGNYELIDQVIAKAIAEARKRGELNQTPLKLTLERAKVGDLPLAFPGKVLADAKSDRLFIADSNHNRIVITRLDGTLIGTVGAGNSGAADGPFDKATFYRPQGMVLDGDNLYVADTENHLIRMVDLKAKSVKTTAGTGQQTRDYFKQGPARSIALSSPWDLELIDRQLYIAMAGPHQIWKMDLNKQEVSTFAGSGREAREDGALLQAGFAQPSGITAIGKKLYIADSESNIIRVIDTVTGRVETLVGGDLFEFGDVDGEGDAVRLQHPLGVVDHGDKILIADTYNHKIKELDPEKRTVKSFAGSGNPGQSNTAFYEPGGLSIAHGRLYVADTNNHAIRVVDLKTRQASTLNLKGLQPPLASPTTNEAEGGPTADESRLTSQRLAVNKDATLIVNATLPAGYHLNPSATHRFRAEVMTGDANLKLVCSGAASEDKLLELKGKKDFTLPIRLTLKPLAAGGADLRVMMTVYYCREDNTGTCFIKTLSWRVPIEVIQSSTGLTEIKLEAKLEAE